MPWSILRDAGHDVVFATERAGTVPAADPRLLTGVLFGQLGAAAFAVTDQNYVSARWPGDAYLFGRSFCGLLRPRA